VNQVFFSSTTDLWETPQWLFNLLDAEHGFDIDVAAVAENAKCANYFSPDVDALTREWKGTCWCNPPYGRDIARFVEKAYKSSLSGATVCCLIPARTDTDYWHRYVTKAAEIRFLKGRLKFGNAKNSAPFPSVIVIFRPGKHAMPRVSFVDMTEVHKTLCGGD
jgi:phage N-6-adenine-methyltransferase